MKTQCETTGCAPLPPLVSLRNRNTVLSLPQLHRVVPNFPPTTVLPAFSRLRLRHTTCFPRALRWNAPPRRHRRAIVTEPEIVLYDSTTAGLDPITSTTIIELL
jgi:hypothetical protein